MNVMTGVVMELTDCALPLLRGLFSTSMNALWSVDQELADTAANVACALNQVAALFCLKCHGHGLESMKVRNEVFHRCLMRIYLKNNRVRFYSDLI